MMVGGTKLTLRLEGRWVDSVCVCVCVGVSSAVQVNDGRWHQVNVETRGKVGGQCVYMCVGVCVGVCGCACVCGGVWECVCMCVWECVCMCVGGCVGAPFCSDLDEIHQLLFVITAVLS